MLDTPAGLPSAMEFALDYQQGDGHGSKGLRELIRKHSGRHARIDGKIVISFPDNSKAVWSPCEKEDAWEIKEKNLAIDFIFEFLDTSDMDPEKFKELYHKYEPEMAKPYTLKFSDGSVAKLNDGGNEWKFR
jgi:hypothetical protein